MSSWQSGPDSSSPAPRDSSGHSRRDFLKYSMAGGVALLGTGGLLDACSSSPTSTSGTTAGGTPKRGGTLHLGGQGGASNDNLDAQNPLTNCDYPRIYALYDPLVNLTPTAGTQLALAES